MIEIVNISMLSVAFYSDFLTFLKVYVLDFFLLIKFRIIYITLFFYKALLGTEVVTFMT